MKYKLYNNELIISDNRSDVLTQPVCKIDRWKVFFYYPQYIREATEATFLIIDTKNSSNSCYTSFDKFYKTYNFPANMTLRQAWYCQKRMAQVEQVFKQFKDLLKVSVQYSLEFHKGKAFIK